MSKTISKKMIELAPNKAKDTHLLIEVNYEKGGANLLGGPTRKRGYHLFAFPVEKFTPEGHDVALIRQELGKGLSVLLLEVSRQSKKAEEKAIALAAEQEAYLIEKVCTRYGLTVKQDCSCKEGA